MRQINSMNTNNNREMSFLGARMTAEYRPIKQMLYSLKRWIHWGSYSQHKAIPARRKLACLSTLRIASLLLVVLYSPVSLSQAVSGTYLVNGGSVWTGTNVHAVLPSTGKFYLNNENSFGYIEYVNLWGKTSDGVSGYLVAPDIVITLNGTVDAIMESRSGIHRTASFSLIRGQDPVATGGVAKMSINNGGYRWGHMGFGVTQEGMDDYNSGTDTINIQPGLWIGPQAEPGTYSIDPVLFADIRFSQSRFNILDSSTIKIVQPMECVIAAPPTVDFGIIHGLGIKENAFIAQKTGDLTINCTSSSQSATANAKVQVLGDALSAHKYILILKNDNGELAPGEIRGWLNQPPTNTCSGGAGATDGLVFGDSSKWYDTEKLKVGANKIPYVFNLCGSGNNKVNNLGPASATATINISWD